MTSRRFWKLAVPASALALVGILPGCGESSSPPPPTATPAPAPEASQDAKAVKGKHKKFADDDMGIREKREQRRKEAAAAGAPAE